MITFLKTVLAKRNNLRLIQHNKCLQNAFLCCIAETRVSRERKKNMTNSSSLVSTYALRARTMNGNTVYTG